MASSLASKRPALKPNAPRAILLDVGFTLTFCDGKQIAAAAEGAGVSVSPRALEDAEAPARREIAGYVWAATVEQQSDAKRKAGPAFFRRLMELAGAVARPHELDLAADAIWAHHLRRNVWCRVGVGVEGALARLRAAGIKLAAVSNSEGTIDALLQEVGLRQYLDGVFDSWVLGVAKPEPRIFALALAHLGVSAEEAIMVGDTPATDIVGARAAGLQAVLIDPYDLHPAAEVPRFSDLAAFVDALLAAPAEHEDLQPR